MTEAESESEESFDVHSENLHDETENRRLTLVP